MTGHVPDGPAGAVAACVHGALPASYLNLTKCSGPLHNRRDTVSPADKVRLSFASGTFSYRFGTLVVVSATFGGVFAKSPHALSQLLDCLAQMRAMVPIASFWQVSGTGVCHFASSWRSGGSSYRAQLFPGFEPVGGR